MAYAALQIVSRKYARATMWDQLEAQLTVTAAGPTTQPAAAVSRRRGSWLNRDR
jgi:hypothetical protein